MKRWKTPLVLIGLCILAVLTGCATLDDKQREWIFQPSDRAWGNSAEAAQGMDELWIPFHSDATDKNVKLHALWLPADTPALAEGSELMSAVGAEATALHHGDAPAETPAAAMPPTPAQTPLLLYLHGARWNVAGSAGRMRRMQQMGFSVLA
ncbi:MAG TPA: hypothetical protein VGC24_12495, partial [Burkholderiaceae bacterium]